jgi:predicted transcriptional regulator
MMRKLTIRLDPKLKKALERVAKHTGRTKTAIAREAIRRHIAVMRFRELRQKILPFA